MARLRVTTLSDSAGYWRRCQVLPPSCVVQTAPLSVVTKPVRALGKSTVVMVSVTHMPSSPTFTRDQVRPLSTLWNSAPAVPPAHNSPFRDEVARKVTPGSISTFSQVLPSGDRSTAPVD